MMADGGISESSVRAGGHHARGKPAVVAGLEHLGDGDAGEHGGGRRRGARDRREAGDREDGGDRKAAGHPAEPPLAGLEQRLRHAGVVGEIADQDEQRQHGERVVDRLGVRDGADHAGARLPADDGDDADEADDGGGDIDATPATTNRSSATQPRMPMASRESSMGISGSRRACAGALRRRLVEGPGGCGLAQRLLLGVDRLGHADQLLARVDHDAQVGPQADEQAHEQHRQRDRHDDLRRPQRNLGVDGGVAQIERPHGVVPAVDDEHGD